MNSVVLSANWLVDWWIGACYWF